MRRFLHTLLPGLVALVALSGCLKLDIDAKVRSDAKVDGTMIVGLSHDMMTMLDSLSALDTTPSKTPKSSKDQWAEAAKRIKKTAGVTDARPYHQDGFDGVQLDFKAVSPAQVINLGNDSTSVANPTGSQTKGKSTMSIVKTGDTFVLKGVLDLGQTSAKGTLGNGDALTKEMLKGSKPQLRVRFTFPGNVIKSNGKISGKSVTWTPVLGKDLVMTAEAKAG